MRQLISMSRRRFGQGLGASLSLTLPWHAAEAHSGAHELEVRVTDFTFAPNRLEIIVGDTVVWINDDFAPHTATAMDGGWGTGRLEKDQVARVSFEAPGKFEYYCVFHPHMTGEVLVRPKGTT